MLKRGFLSWAIAIAAASTAAADVIYLTNGGVLEGKVERVAEGYRVTTETGVSVFPVEEVERWEKRPTRKEEYALRAAATPLDDFYAQMSLAEWCRSHDLPDEARYHFLLAVALDPRNAEARRGAGYVREGGAWITVEDSRRRRGLVEVNGKWLPEEEALRQQLAAEREKRTQTAIAEATRIFQEIKNGDADLEPWAEKIAAFGPCLLPTLERFSCSREVPARCLAFLALERFACRASLELLMRRLTTEQQDEALRA
ncbi:MAG: hypothetical protein N3A66_04525, partial [Planctomycetota bacterium]|nr:hypothetical protein [Planctomycetota bacterium]